MYYSFCCCLCRKSASQDAPEAMEATYISKLKSNFNHLKRKKVNEDVKSIYAMVQLLKKEPQALSYLAQVRINPKLSRSDGDNTGKSKKGVVRVRNDLEFFLPQILSHYLRSDLTAVEEETIKCFLLAACRLNMFFSHKVWFNLKGSLVNKQNEP